MTGLLLAWISGPWAFLLVVALFVALALLAVPFIALHDFIERGLRRRRERLHGWSTDPRSITDREIERLR